MTQADGGKGGSFFLFTSDDKLIIKTMSQDDFNVFQDTSLNYFRYFEEKSHSLIAKIYGIFQFRFDDFTDMYETVMVIRNISGIVILYNARGSQ